MKQRSQKTLSLLLLLSSFIGDLRAQETPDFKGPIVYLELLGNSGPAYSLSIEHIIFKTPKIYCNARIGYGYFKTSKVIEQSVPLGINFFVGKRKSHLEGGLGLSYAEGVEASLLNISDRSKAFYFVPSVGYRFQKSTSGFFFRAAFTPFFKIKDVGDYHFIHVIKIAPYLGVSLGYFFSRKD